MADKNEHGQPIGFPMAEWTGATHPNHHSLVGQYVQLDRISDTKHCAALFEAFASDKKGTNWTYLPYGPFNQLADFKAWFESNCFQDDPLFYVVSSKSTQMPVGVASYLRIIATAGSIEVGHIHFSPLLQRTPMATEVMYLMMHNAFEVLNYRRYEWKCDSLNEPSMRAAKRLGFTYEGTFRQALVYKQRNRDTAWLSITDKEWPAINAGFELWLSPENFNAQGEQVLTLEACRAQVFP